ncbi:type-F conjugative transfer system pilin assembly protein TrbC [Vibrio coralliilyticus]|uniref:type-F conjugative transfer system pilin assembly protein TrbC n=1 Tax=Vibrio TaxID=662 RepID=UPI0005019B10|nr:MULTISPECIES: type-F conjugative transfer system pilin assembly protein TrbC [Vibrio]KFI12067.1 conjugal transfer protein TrbC [Vibrio sp. B183]NOI21184.1 type-F conjugative transfer system pilin assembly protein TrbC [Vibrio coralliilyticus]
MPKALLFVLAFWLSTPALSYTEDELKALAKREQAMTQIKPTEQFDEVWNRARQQQHVATQTGTTVQALVKPNAITELLGTPKPTKNPNRAPKGIMVFVSLTMPDTALKQLLRQSAHAQIPLVIRGVLPQGFPATTSRISHLIGQNSKQPIESGFAISPEWFQQFNIQRVPAFVSVRDGHCLPKQPCSANDYDVVYGNISLYQALNILEGGDAGENARLVNKRLQR